MATTKPALLWNSDFTIVVVLPHVQMFRLSEEEDGCVSIYVTLIGQMEEIYFDVVEDAATAIKFIEDLNCPLGEQADLVNAAKRYLATQIAA